MADKLQKRPIPKIPIIRRVMHFRKKCDSFGIILIPILVVY